MIMRIAISSTPPARAPEEALMTAHQPARPSRSHSRECCIHEAIHSRKMEGIHRDPAPGSSHDGRDGVHAPSSGRSPGR